MRKIILCILAICTTIGLKAEKLEDHYVVRTLPDALLYFVLPYEVPSLQKTPAAEIDITYPTNQDSLRVNMSIYTDKPLKVDSIVFITETSMRTTDFETFFIDKNGKNYIHRYSCFFPYSLWQKMYTCDKPFRLCIYAEQQKFEYGYSQQKWNKENLWMQRILLLINRNKQIRRN